MHFSCPYCGRSSPARSLTLCVVLITVLASLLLLTLVGLVVVLNREPSGPAWVLPDDEEREIMERLGRRARKQQKELLKLGDRMLREGKEK